MAKEQEQDPAEKIDLDLDEEIKHDLVAVKELGQASPVVVSLIDRTLRNQDKLADKLRELLLEKHDRQRDRDFYTKWGERAGYFITAVFVAGVGAFFSYLFTQSGKPK